MAPEFQGACEIPIEEYTVIPVLASDNKMAYCLLHNPYYLLVTERGKGLTKWRNCALNAHKWGSAAFTIQRYEFPVS